MELSDRQLDTLVERVWERVKPRLERESRGSVRRGGDGPGDGAEPGSGEPGGGAESGAGGDADGNRESGEASGSDARAVVGGHSEPPLVRLPEEFYAFQRQMVDRLARVEEHLKAHDKRFEDVNKRFDDVNKRFEDVNRRFDDVNKRFATVQWLIGLSFVLLSSLMTLYTFLV